MYAPLLSTHAQSLFDNTFPNGFAPSTSRHAACMAEPDTVGVRVLEPDEVGDLIEEDEAGAG